MYFLNLFSSFYVSNVLSISSSSSFDECKLDGGNRFFQYVYVPNSDVGVSLSDHKLTSRETHRFHTLKAYVDTYMLPIDR